MASIPRKIAKIPSRITIIAAIRYNRLRSLLDKKFTVKAVLTIAGNVPKYQHSNHTAQNTLCGCSLGACGIY